jgi:G3E family GTPase
MSRTPLNVLTGFLGSGKTTLLNRLLRDPALADTAVLINEIGAVSIDHHLVERMAPGDALDIVVLKGGCTCCALRGDLVAALLELHRRRAEGSVPPFTRVVLETTGLADPAPILFTLAADPALRHKYEAVAVVATVDALNGAAQLADHPECRKQIAVADRIVVTKSDLAGSATAAALAAEVARLNPAAELVSAAAECTAAALVDGAHVPLVAPAPLGTPGSGGAAVHRHAPAADHTPDVASITVTLDEPLDWSLFAVWLTLLLHAHGDRMLRFKALLDVAGWPVPLAMDAVHHLIHPPVHLTRWPAGPRRSCLVFIAQGLPMQRIEASLRQMIASGEPASAWPAQQAPA